MSDAGMLEAKDIVQINATMIVGILIFYTIPYIIKGGPSSRKEPPHDTALLYSIALAIALFAASAILAIVPILPLFTSEILTICGFIAITAAGFIFIKVIKAAKYVIKEAKEAKKASEILQPEPSKDEMSEEVQKEKEAKKASEILQPEPSKDEMSEEVQKDEKVIEESKTYEVLSWKDPMKEQDERSAHT